jgi:phospholipase C
MSRPVDPHLNRRRFLGTSAAAAASAFLASCGVMGRKAPIAAVPAGANDSNTQWPIKRVVYLMLENRSFDHVFGAMKGVNGARTGVMDGKEVPLIRCPQWLPGDVPHSRGSAIRSYNHGKMDGFAQDDISVVYAYSQLDREDVPNYWHWAEDYVISDNFFSSVLGPSFPNHLYMIAGQSGGAVDTPTGQPWGCDHLPGTTVRIRTPEGKAEDVDPCMQFRTMGDTLDDAGVSWAYYAASEHQVGYIWSAFHAVKHIYDDRDKMALRVRPVDSLLGDIAAERLPAVTWITPRFELSDHPPWSSSHAHNWVTKIVNSIMRSSMWESTAIFITWDEWGGFYDHVAPPQVDETGLGIRVPMLLVSPYAKEGFIDHEQGDFTSPLRFIDDNWGLPHLTKRIAKAHNYSHAFDFRRKPRPPHPRPIKTDAVGEPFVRERFMPEWPPDLVDEAEKNTQGVPGGSSAG